MKTPILLFLFTMLTAAALTLTGCTQPGTSGGSPDITITASAGALTGNGTSYSFAAGTVPQYATETIVFTVKNSGSVAFTATGSASFTNSDFSTDIGGSLAVPANSSATFNGFFTPTSSSGQEPEH